MNARTAHTGTAEKLEQLPIAHVILSDTQTQDRRRRRFTDESLADLTASVRQNGVAQPVLVRALVGDGADALKRLGKETYQLVDGERRYRAALAAGLSHIPAIITNIAAEELVLFQITTNKHHESLHPLDEAAAIEETMKVQSLSVEEAAERLGMKRAHAYNRLKLLQLAPEVLEALESGKLPATHALHIARIPGPKLQKKALKIALTPTHSGPLTERELADHLRRSFMVRIDQAPFKASDEGLDPRRERATCLGCPHYSANDTELHAEVEAEHGIGATLCTDKPCHDEKVQALYLRRIELARTLGTRIIEGDEAKAVMPHRGTYSLEGYVDLAHECEEIEMPDDAAPGWRAPTYREVLKDQKVPLALMIDPFSGEPREVVDGPTALKLLKKAGVKVTRGLNSYDPPGQEEPRDPEAERKAHERQQARQELDKAYRRLLFIECHKKFKGPLKRDDWEAIAGAVCDSGAGSEIADLVYGGDLKLADLSEKELQRVALFATLNECLWHSANLQPLLGLAKRLRINPEKLKKQAKDELGQEKE